MSEALQRELQAIDWSNYESACGFDSTEIPSLLVAIYSDSADSKRAIDRLWNVVCHQSNIGSNAVPTLPFLARRLATAEPDLKTEILDIVYSFACFARMCANGKKEDLSLKGWRNDLAVALIEHRADFAVFLRSSNGDLVEWAEMIEEQLAVVADAL